ncbi:cytochrome c biogenesis protein ResB [Mangrovibacillus cuniculi]|uniref:Cytochrome C biogenesis protein n=1 Tax=Mangrovibacillus cuniculi TaxID=2593652 RepID=A0A7S8CB69_9BACI|nr:cytochrome c biogenesis protein ResB [Mangrovibacillus cuniculi]QPC46737.1 cytochrome C biogenesis protein [Mangrovibacillus cuniculi]
MKNITCECGHINTYGTVLCQACGQALTEEAKKEAIHDMRYEGSARRSQTYNKTIIDQIWNFFSSVKVGVTIIIVTLIASAIGTIFPQEMYIPPNINPAVHYADQYGSLGTLYYTLGFHNLYSSWWYLLLIGMLGTSIIIASLDRGIPLYKSLKNQRVTRHDQFMKKQRLVNSVSSSTIKEEDYELVKEKLKKKRYKIREENGNILAEKNRFSRWGAYVNHVGLIIFLIGGVLRFVPGFYVDELLWIEEGETYEIPGTDKEYSLKNEQFIFEQYQQGEAPEVFDAALERNGIIAKNFQSNVVLYKNGENGEQTEVKKDQIRVNEPLKFDGFAVYQVDFRLNQFQKMSFSLDSKADPSKSYGSFTVDLFNPARTYELNDGAKVELKGYYPDYAGINANGEPESKSPVPNNPAFLFSMITPETPNGETAFLGIQQNVEPLGENQFKLSFAGLDTRNISGLTIRKDLTLWVLALGGLIFMIGVMQGSYWNHRRLWIKRSGEITYISGLTNKNWLGLKRELDGVMEGTGFPLLHDQREQFNERKEGTA